MRFNRTAAPLIITALAAVALLAAPVLAQGGPMKPGRCAGHGAHGPGMGLHRGLEQLDLSAEQREQLEQIRARHQEETRLSHDQLQAAHERFADLAHAETLDETALREAAATMAEARTEMMIARAGMMNEIRQILTPEQLEQFQQMRQRRGGMMRGQGRGPGRGGHGPHGPADCPYVDQAPDAPEE